MIEVISECGDNRIETEGLTAYKPRKAVLFKIVPSSAAQHAVVLRAPFGGNAVKAKIRTRVEIRTVETIHFERGKCECCDCERRSGRQ